MIDTHAHLDFENFDEDREEVIRRAFDNGVKKIMNIGVDLKTSKRSIDIAEGHENIFAAVGFHPHDAGEKLSLPADEDIEELKKMASHEKVRAIGEIGLDYFYYKDPEKIKQQKILLEKQLKVASALGLPVVIHCREAWEDLFTVVSKYNEIGFVLHCYSGEKKDTEKFLKLPNVHFSFSGNITYPKPVSRSEKLIEAVQMIPLDRIMLDSDSPFLSPQAMRGKRNEPMFVRYIAEKIAEIKEISVEDAEKKTDENAERFFGVG
ncbi:MAG: TatD family hydrolase [Parcubacteria group bacterium]|jgi:TatD DNase family protein